MSDSIHNEQPRLYTELAEWWPLLSAPSEYVEEAALYLRLLQERVQGPLETLLELGCGGGNNACHFPKTLALTLVDLSPGMLAVSQRLNPHAHHVQGDMRTVDVGAQFDAVFIQDAIDYMTTEADLRAAIQNAARHLRPGGAVLLAPDDTREVFTPYTAHGGTDGEDGRSLRYLFWETDPDPSDTLTSGLMTYVLREPGQPVRTLTEEHTYGLFPRATWIQAMEAAGLTRVERLPFVHSDFEEGVEKDLFVGVKR